MYNTLSFLSGLALVSAVQAGVVERRQAPNGPCPTGVHIMAAGGSNSTDPTSLGRLAPLPMAIMARIPGSTLTSLPYNKVNTAPQMLEPGAVAAGTATFARYVQEFHSACPNGKIVVLGYSSGGVLTQNGLCPGGTTPIDTSLAGSTIIANVVYGDDTFTAGQPYDRGTCQQDSKRTRGGGCGAFNAVSRSYCDTNDPQCCNGPKEDYQIHFVYPGKYDDDATDFVVSQFMASGGATGSSSSSLSSSASMTASMTDSSATSMATSTGMSSLMPYPIASSMMMANSSTMVPPVVPIPSMATDSLTPASSAASSMTSVVTSAGGAASSAVVTVTSGGAAAASSVMAGAASGASNAGAAASSTLTPANPNGASNIRSGSALAGAVVFFAAALLL